jgi:hypothetical protein
VAASSPLVPPYVLRDLRERGLEVGRDAVGVNFVGKLITASFAQLFGLAL